MSILDDAIREHLELKRAHGADEAEVKKLEDEAFGPPGRPEEPDPAAEAPTEFMTTPGAAEAVESAEDGGGRRINIADLQEPPEPSEPQEEPRIEATEAVEPQADAAPIVPAEDPAQAAPPAEEEPPAIEHEIVPEAEAQPEPVAENAGPSTEERHAIAEQPTEFFDIEAEMGTEDAPAAEAPSPSDEEIVEAEAAEPLAPVEPPTEIHASRTELPEEEDEDDDFWSEQRLSDELDQALEAPVTDEHEAPAPPAEEPAQLFDSSQGEDAREDDQPQADYDPDTGHEDVLEDTPEFLEESPEDDELWFEQRPPKDFDFDD
ncbi:MAG TPA: hypothetical protein VLI94_00385 [Solirubrobacterales bacterium]|nr:hypothetical protein [Solirubrobacterales bacterium]